ncbi:SPFH domain-containing protein [Halococcoides cellulosivorans]|nr:SPFH domain-containing protein [Halococcoides cellulosivorans]
MLLLVLGVALAIAVLVVGTLLSVTRVGPDDSAYRFVRGELRGPVDPGWTIDFNELYAVEVVDTEMGPLEYDVHTVTSDDVGVTVSVEGTIEIDDVEGFVNPHAGETSPLYYGDPMHTMGARIVRTGREELTAWSLDALSDDREDIARRLRRAIDERLRDDPISLARLDITAIDAPAADRSSA